jgi:hypothetical protein
VLSLEVQGDVMKLLMAVTPRFASVSDDDSVSQFAALGETSSSPTLVDLDNLKQYAVIRAGNSVLSSGDLEVTTRNGSPMLTYAYFAAPEDDIDAIDVKLTDFWPAFADVPITR